MDSALASLLGALVGALAGIAGGWLGNWHQARLEREKWLRSRSDDFAREVRTSVRELTTELATATHAMSWLCWLAKSGPDRLTQARIDQYDNEMHRLLPRLDGLHAVIAGMDADVYHAFDAHVEKVIRLDVRIGEASLKFVPGMPETAAPLASLLADTQTLARALDPAVARAIGGYAPTAATARARS